VAAEFVHFPVFQLGRSFWALLLLWLLLANYYNVFETGTVKLVC
jgi:hypothetical protein